MFALYVWSCLMGCPICDLSNDKFEIRDKATENMMNNFPFSLPVVWQGLFSDDPEVKYRCQSVLNKKANWIIFASKFSPNIIDLLTRDKYPTFKHAEALKTVEDWNNFCDVMIKLKLHDPKLEHIAFQDKEGSVWMMWARAKAIRYGQDPKVGQSILPIIKPGQEPKNKP